MNALTAITAAPADLNLLAARALEAKVCGFRTADLHRGRFIEALTESTGLSEGMFGLLRMEGLLP